jgi:adenylate cyclase
VTKVLLVDDEQGNVESLEAVMKDEAKFDIEFFTATDEHSALQIISDNDIDVVVTDLVMSDEHSGLHVLRGAKEKDPLSMVILLTAYETKLDRYEAFELGAFDCVPKNMVGINPGLEILYKVKGAIEFRRLAKNQIEHEKSKANLGRYFDPGVFKLLENEPDLLKPSNRMATIVFWDIRGFSALSENLKAYPFLITGFLEEYFDLMAEIIFKHGGVLDKFIGDGTMAIFGLTDVQTENETKEIEHASSALISALEINPRFEELVSVWNEKWGLYSPQEVRIGLGCGIHTGEAIIGKIGTSVRDQFTALGSSVNFSSRLCSRAQSRQILVSNSTQLRCREKFDMEKIGELTDIKNIPGVFPYYNVKGLKLPSYTK